MRETDTTSGDALTAAWTRLEAAVRQPCGVFPARWCASTDAGPAEGPAYDLRDLFPLCVAWRSRSLQIAREFVLSAVALQHPDGSFPRRVDESGDSRDPTPGWLLFACAANAAAGEFPPADYAGVVLPAVERHVEWAWQHLNAAAGSPRWPTERDAWVPEAWDPSVRSVDATAMLLAEIEACLQLAERCDAGGAARLRFGARAAELARLLDREYFDAASGEYRDRAADGRPIARRTLSVFAPLLCSSLDPSRRRHVLDALGRWWEPASCSFPAWERWPDDPTPPPVVPRQQAMVWAALAERGGGETPEWRERAAAVAAAPWAQSGVSGALAAIIASVACGRAPASAVATTRRRVWAIAAASAVGFLFLLATGIYLMRRPSLPGATGEAILNLARERYNAGDHEQAISLYREFLARSRSTNGVVCVLLANALYRADQYEEAERFYRVALREEVSALHALYNLGLTLHQQGRDEEAVYVLDQFADTYRDDFPELAQRARTAVAIIRGLPLETVDLP